MQRKTSCSVPGLLRNQKNEHYGLRVYSTYLLHFRRFLDEMVCKPTAAGERCQKTGSLGYGAAAYGTLHWEPGRADWGRWAVLVFAKTFAFGKLETVDVATDFQLPGQLGYLLSVAD